MPLSPETSLDAEQLICTLTPALVDGTLSDALETVRLHWSTAQLIALLAHRNGDVRKVAALALGFVGGAPAIAPLAVALHDPDMLVTQVAEHALWCIWFRQGKCCSVSLLRAGSSALSTGHYPMAIDKFSEAIAVDPDFAEAYNQRAIAYYLAERYLEAIVDCQAALERIPQHFGAMAGMGHCYAHLQRYAEARRCYRLALAIHPRLEGIDTSLQQVEQILQRD